MKNHIWLIYLLFLASGASAAQNAQGKLNIFIGHERDPDAENFRNKLGSFQLDSPDNVLNPEDIQIRKHKTKPLTLNVEVKKEVIQRINHHLEQGKDKHLIFSKTGHILFAPKIKKKLEGTKFEWTFSDEASFRKALKRLNLKS